MGILGLSSVSVLVFALLTLQLCGSGNSQPLNAADQGVIRDLLMSFPDLRSAPYLWTDSAQNACSFPQGVQCTVDSGTSYVNFIKIGNSTSYPVGAIPPTMGNLPKITSLSIYATFPSTGIPSLVGMKSLQNLKLTGNPTNRTVLSQPFPSEMLNGMDKLKSAEFSYLNFSGTANPEIQRSGLILLSFQSCGLTVFPNVQASANTLLEMRLDDNSLSGAIPTWIGVSMKLLARFTASRNRLNSIPAEINQAPALQLFDVSYNSIEGQLPTISSLTKLQFFDVSYNALVSSILPFPVAPNLVSANFSSNKFSGSIHSSISSLTGLTAFNISNNQISGSMPNMSALTKLSYLDIHNNNISGDFSSSQLQQAPLTFCNTLNNTNLICPYPIFNLCCASNAPPTTAATTATTATTATVISVAAATTTTTATTAIVTSAATTATTTMTATTTTTTNSSPQCVDFTCVCSSNLTAIITNSSICRNGVWVISGSTTNNDTVTVAQGDTIIINGSLSQSAEGSLQVYANASSGGSLQVNNNATLGGTLVIIVTGQINDQKNISIINASSVNGTFSNVQVVQQFEGSKCYTTKAESVYTSTGVGVLVSQSKKASCGSKGKTIAIAVGASIGGLILIIIIIIIVLILIRKHSKMGQSQSALASPSFRD